MFNQMGEVLPGLFVGSHEDALDRRHLKRLGITHIVSIMDNPKREQLNKHYLCIMAYDLPEENLSQYFSVCNDFIHEARLSRKSVLINCLGGVSRSVTLAIAYIMSVTSLNWRDALDVVRSERCIALPNIGFLKQLDDFQTIRLNVERHRLKYKFPSKDYEHADKEWCSRALKVYGLLLASNPQLFDPVPELNIKGNTKSLEDTSKTHLTNSTQKKPAFGLWSNVLHNDHHKSLQGEIIMANVRLYRPMPKKDRDSFGKFVKPIDSCDKTEIYDEDEEGHDP